jgi:phosphotransferase system enzyme I (PtsI)
MSERPAAPEEDPAEAPAPDPSAAADSPAAPAPGLVLRGATVAPGLVVGTIYRKDYDLTRATGERVPLEEVEAELNRFRRAIDDSKRQLAELKARLEGRVEAQDARILDTHVALLKDSAFIADVENLILNEQLRLESSISKVIADFDRIFRLVRDDHLRQSAVDLRDVGLRVLRNLERHARDRSGAEPPPSEYVLAARELSIVDMFNLNGEHVQGIVTEEGGLTSHAAIFARSMRIPTLTGVTELLEHVHEGDYVILDATEGVLRVEPDEVVRAQYATPETLAEAAPVTTEGVPDWALAETLTRDGEAIEVTSSCGNLPEVEQAASLGRPTLGLYRTELMYLVDADPPSREALVHHYAAVLAATGGAGVTFRLLNVDSSLGLRWMHPEPEPNPVLGRAGVRALLKHESVLRRQLQAMLLAGVDAEVSLAVPFVTDCGELRRVKEILFDERVELRKSGERLNLDALEAYLLAADRDHKGAPRELQPPHPFVLRALTKACQVAASLQRPLHVFGPTASHPAHLEMLVGVGLRHFCVPPAALRPFLEEIPRIDSRQAGRAARAAARSSCRAETQSLVGGFRHGYAPPRS